MGWNHDSDHVNRLSNISEQLDQAALLVSSQTPGLSMVLKHPLLLCPQRSGRTNTSLFANRLCYASIGLPFLERLVEMVSPRSILLGMLKCNERKLEARLLGGSVLGCAPRSLLPWDNRQQAQPTTQCFHPLRL